MMMQPLLCLILNASCSLLNKLCLQTTLQSSTRQLDWYRCLRPIGIRCYHNCRCRWSQTATLRVYDLCLSQSIIRPCSCSRDKMLQICLIQLYWIKCCRSCLGQQGLQVCRRKRWMSSRSTISNRNCDRCWKQLMVLLLRWRG